MLTAQRCASRSSGTFEFLPKDACDPHKYPFFDLFYGFGLNDKKEWRRIGEDWLMTAGALALNLVSYTNNTCLTIAIEFVDSGRVMLFPGDSQFANWRSWQKLLFKVPKSDGRVREVKFEDLLAKTVFYKVGHHGSHNATLKKNGLEKMCHPEFSAMIPVDREMAKKKTSKNNPHGWEMPEGDFFERLLERTSGRVVLADDNDNAGLAARCSDKRFINNIKFGGMLTREGRPDENLYVEYTLVDE